MTRVLNNGPEKERERQMERNKIQQPKKQITKATGKCPAFGKCGGCQYINRTYEEQLECKRKYLNRLLSEFGRVETVLGMENPYHYRNKVNATFKHLRNGEIIAGTYEEGSHRVIETKGCLIENEKADEIIETIRQLVKSFKITVHNEDTGYGILRHVMIRTAHATGQIMVVLVTATPILPSKKNLAKALLARHPEITTIVQNINEKKTSMVLGARNEVIYGKGYIEDVLLGKVFRLSPTSFYQVNSVQTEVLYRTAIDMAGLTGWETIIDAYCGIGTIGIVASDHAKQVIGVELNKDAVRDAILNTKNNKCKNVSIYNNDAGRFMVGLADRNEHIDVVFMDPPRSGSNEAFMSSVIKLSPEKIVYISCGPESLARDLRFFKKHSSYRVTGMVACDMFPWTEHVECIACIQREKG